jgi:hypothetical protein
MEEGKFLKEYTIGSGTHPSNMLYVESYILGYNTMSSVASRRVVTSTWWEGLVLPMIPRAMPAGA